MDWTIYKQHKDCWVWADGMGNYCAEYPGDDNRPRGWNGQYTKPGTAVKAFRARAREFAYRRAQVAAGRVYLGD